MSVVEWSTPFMSTIISYGDIIPNTYEVCLGISPLTDKVDQQNIGFDRIKFFLKNICQNSVMVNIHNNRFESLKKLTDSKFMTLPDEPFDQLLVVLLFYKIDSILGKYFNCDYIILESFQGENVKYHYDLDYDSSFIDEKTYYTGSLYNKKLPWWYRDDTSVSDNFEDMSVVQYYTWADLNLSYTSKKKKEKKHNIINLKQFFPKVIDGKK